MLNIECSSSLIDSPGVLIKREEDEGAFIEIVKRKMGQKVESLTGNQKPDIEPFYSKVCYGIWTGQR